MNNYHVLYDVSLPTGSFFDCVRCLFCQNTKVQKTRPFAMSTLCEELHSTFKTALDVLRDTSKLEAYNSRHNSMLTRERIEYQKEWYNARLHLYPFCLIIGERAYQPAFSLPHLVANNSMREASHWTFAISGFWSFSSPENSTLGPGKKTMKQRLVTLLKFWTHSLHAM